MKNVLPSFEIDVTEPFPRESLRNRISPENLTFRESDEESPIYVPEDAV